MACRQSARGRRKPLPKGIYYKIIASGRDKDGRAVAWHSAVTAHYTGRTINGRTFDSSRGGSPPQHGSAT